MGSIGVAVDWMRSRTVRMPAGISRCGCHGSGRLVRFMGMSFESFAAEVGPRLRHALVAAYGLRMSVSMAATDDVGVRVRTLGTGVRHGEPGGLSVAASSQTAAQRLVRRPVRLPQADVVLLPEMAPELVPALEALSEQQHAVVVLVAGLQWRQSEVAHLFGGVRVDRADASAAWLGAAPRGVGGSGSWLISTNNSAATVPGWRTRPTVSPWNVSERIRWRCSSGRTGPASISTLAARGRRESGAARRYRRFCRLARRPDRDDRRRARTDADSLGCFDNDGLDDRTFPRAWCPPRRRRSPGPCRRSRFPPSRAWSAPTLWVRPRATTASRPFAVLPWDEGFLAITPQEPAMSGRYRAVYTTDGTVHTETQFALPGSDSLSSQWRGIGSWPLIGTARGRSGRAMSKSIG